MDTAQAEAKPAAPTKEELIEILSADPTLFAQIRAAIAAKAPKLLRIGGEVLDLTEYPPITQGDKKSIKKEPYSLSMRNSAEWEEEQESIFVWFLLQRVRPKTTIDEVDKLDAKLLQEVMRHCMQRSAEVDYPFSTRSTALHTNTAGASAK